MYMAGRLNLDDMLTRQYSLEEVNDDYVDMLAGKNVRGILRVIDTNFYEYSAKCHALNGNRWLWFG